MGVPAGAGAEAERLNLGGDEEEGVRGEVEEGARGEVEEDEVGAVWVVYSLVLTCMVMDELNTPLLYVGSGTTSVE